MIDKEKRLLKALRKAVSQFLNENVTRPSLETAGKDIIGQAHLVAILLFVKDSIHLTHKEGLTFDKELLMALPVEKVEKRINTLQRFLATNGDAEATDNFDEKDALAYLFADSSKKYLLAYLTREINWIAVSVLSASYVSSLILMRSFFELLMGLGTNKMGSMNDRIDQITFLDDIEKKHLKTQWRGLCAWGHPYGKWLKEVCPVYASHRPLYHPKLFELCLEELTKLVDFFLVIVISKYEIKASKIKRVQKKLKINISNFKLLSSRLRA